MAVDLAKARPVLAAVLLCALPLVGSTDDPSSAATTSQTLALSSDLRLAVHQGRELGLEVRVGEGDDYSAIARRVCGGEQYAAALQAELACFVTLNKHGALRGCIGTLHASHPLVSEVARLAHAAAFELSVMQDDNYLIYSSAQSRATALGRMQKMGVDAVRVSVAGVASDLLAYGSLDDGAYIEGHSAPVGQPRE